MAAARAPSFEDWLNDLSSSWPTSVTTPTLIGLSAAEARRTGPPSGRRRAALTGRRTGRPRVRCSHPRRRTRRRGWPDPRTGSSRTLLHESSSKWPAARLRDDARPGNRADLYPGRHRWRIVQHGRRVGHTPCDAGSPRTRRARCATWRSAIPTRSGRRSRPAERFPDQLVAALGRRPAGPPAGGQPRRQRVHVAPT